MFGGTNSRAAQQSFSSGERRTWENRQAQSSFSATRPAQTAEPQQGKRVIDASVFMHKPANLRRVSDVERDFYAPKSNHAALSVGMIVQHDRFGVGEVQSTEGTGENAKATIKFQNAGVKTLLLKFAKLKTIG